MSALVAALDTHTPTQVGANGHLQYGWSNDIKEKILQFSFQLTRCDKSVVRTALASKFREIMAQVPVSAKIDDNNLLTLIMQMIVHTRDIVNGKGEYELAYMMIYELLSLCTERVTLEYGAQVASGTLDCIARNRFKVCYTINGQETGMQSIFNLDSWSPLHRGRK